MSVSHVFMVCTTLLTVTDRHIDTFPVRANSSTKPFSMLRIAELHPLNSKISFARFITFSAVRQRNFCPTASGQTAGYLDPSSLPRMEKPKRMEAPSPGRSYCGVPKICSTCPLPIGSSQCSGILTISFEAGQRELNQVCRKPFSQ